MTSSSYFFVIEGTNEKESREHIPMPLVFENGDNINVAEMRQICSKPMKILYSKKLRFSVGGAQRTLLQDDARLPCQPSQIFVQGPFSVLLMLILELRKWKDKLFSDISKEVPNRDGYPQSSAGIAPQAPPCAVLPANKARLPVGLMFPGQGSQYVGMLAEVQTVPAIAEMLDRASRILQWDILDLCLHGPADKLESTRYCQPIMFVSGLAGLEKLRLERKDAVECCGAVAGLSLGEYTALCAAGVYCFEDGLKLVQVRAECMEEAATQCPQGMVSIAGLDYATVEGLCKQAVESTGAHEVCAIANVLFPKGFACSGTRAAVDKLAALAQQKEAQQVKLLKTGGGFHTSLMAPAACKLKEALTEALPRMRPPQCDVYMNATGSVLKAGTAPEEICKLLEKQITCTVQWESCVREMIQAGLTEFFEVGPMKQLKAMMKRIDAAMWKKTTNIGV